MQLRLIIKQKKFQYIFALILITTIWLCFSIFNDKYNDIGVIKNNIEQKIHYKERQVEKILDNYLKFSNQYNFEDEYFLFKQKDFNDNQSYFFYYYEEKQLKFWSSNQVPVPEYLDTTKLAKEVWEMKNGIYGQKHVYIKNKNSYIVCLFLIQNKYPYENLFLSNTFDKSFNVSDNVKLVITPSENQVTSKNGNYLFSLYKETLTISDERSIVNSTLTFIILILLLLLIDNYIKSKRILIKYKYLFYTILIISIIAIRALSFIFKFPDFIYNSQLFGPNYFASSNFLPSLGDLLLNSICLFISVFILFFRIKVSRFKKIFKVNPNIFNLLLGFILLGFVPLLFNVVVSLFYSVIINTNVQIATENIFKFQFLSYLLFLIFLSLLGSLFLLFLKLFIVSKNLFNNKKPYKAALLFVAIISTFYSYLKFNQIEFSILSICLIYTIFYITNSYKKKKNSVILLLFILYSSVFTTITINIFNGLKEEDNRMLIAMKIANEHDPIVEYRLREVLQEIPKDQTINRLIRDVNKNEQAIIEYLLKEHLSTFIYRYKILITICSENQNLMIQPDNYEINCAQFFNKKINTFGSYKSYENVWYMNYEPGTVSYLSMVKIPRQSEDSIYRNYTIYIELDSKSYISDIGYPELLIDKKRSNINPDISNYSYARYIYDDLVSQYGKFFYSTNLSTYNIEKDEPKFFNNNGYRHLIFKANDKETIIIGKKISNYFERLVPISLFIIFYGLIVFVLYLLFSAQPFVFSFSKLNFQAKLQFTMILIILSSFLVICIMTVVYFVSLNVTKNQEIVTEKSHSILIQLEQQFHQVKEVNSSNIELFNDLIQKLSGQFFTDINLFDRYGNLIASSRPQMFHQGLISSKINTEAINELRKHKKTIFMHEEMIGKQKYISSYMPFRNNKGVTLAYINLPYFAKQEDLNREISSFLIAFLSVYVLLTLIAISITIFFANYITRPLKLMRDKIGQIKLRGKNEKINWNSKDELGALIVEYNRMVDELTKSAELLASSERDYAWQEMAQQVAHEIKNPLTPMKLSIQYLQRAWDNKEPDWDDRLKRFSQTLVEQIDALSAIATSFSDFAKMPKGEFNNEDLSETIKSVIALFEDNNQKIKFENDGLDYYLVSADKNQLIRVLNNLIKNALQAIRDTREGEIKIFLKQDGEEYLLTIADNGVGISDNLKHKIFSPNFTTKTGGMGLGLAMVKNIVKSMNGEIWFESEEGIGTTFYIKFPKKKND